MIPLIVDTAMTYDRAERGWGCLDTARGRLPLAAVDVDVRIVGLAATTELRQTFVNHLHEAIEATYVFPLPDRAAVTRFRMAVGNRVIEGRLDERGAARAAYDQAVATGHRAAIAEEDRAGVFSLRVGNLMPGEVAVISLALTGPLAVDDGEVTWMFPLVVAPRYIPGAALPGDQAGLGTALDTDQVPDASRISPPVMLPGLPNPVRLGVRVAIDGGGLPIGHLRGNLAELDARVEGRGWQIALRPGQRLDRDLILRWQIGAVELRSSAVWAPDADGAGGTVAITIVPPVASAAGDRPRDVVIVLDRSGSMGGWKMVAARRAAARVVDSLTARDGFVVLAFDNRVDTAPGLGAAWAPATDRNRFRAVEFLAGIEARGGTELAQPLQMALSALPPRPDRDQIVVLVTDGQVGNEDLILQQLAGRIGDVRMFTLGIDQAVNAAFLRRLAGLGGGACELVESEDRLDEVMGKIHRRIATPLLTDLAIRGIGLDLASQTPRRLPAVFAGAPVTVYLRTTGRPAPGQAIEIGGRLPAGTTTTTQVALDAAWPGVDLEAAWARGHLRDLEDQYASRGGGDPELERRIVATSIRHRVLSRFTAFVAIDLAEIANRGRAPRPIVQPVETPAGWAGGAPPPSGMPSAVRSPTYASGAFTGSVGGGAGYGGRAKADSSARESGAAEDRTRGRGPGSMPGAPPPSMASHAPPPPMTLARPAPSAPSWSPPAEAKSEAPDPRIAISADSLMAELDRAAPADDGVPKVKRAIAAPAPPQATRQQQRREQAEDAERARRPASTGIDTRPYLQRLSILADQLAAAAATPRPVDAAQLPIARLAELLEDVRSVGLTALADALQPLLDRLRAALAAATLAATLVDVADLIRPIVQHDPTSPGRPPGRSSFWK